MKTRAENRLDLIAAAAAFVQATQVELYYSAEAGTLIASVDLSRTEREVYAIARAMLDDIARAPATGPGRRRKGDA